MEKRSWIDLIIDELLEAMDVASLSEREAAFGRIRYNDKFCSWCGSEHLPCHCMNDD